MACRRLLCLSATYIQVSLIIASFMLLLMSTKVCPEIKNLSIDLTLCWHCRISLFLVHTHNETHNLKWFKFYSVKCYSKFTCQSSKGANVYICKLNLSCQVNGIIRYKHTASLRPTLPRFLVFLPWVIAILDTCLVFMLSYRGLPERPANILCCFDNFVLCFDNFVLCFDNFVLCFDNFVLCFDNFGLCFTNIDLCFKNIVLCFKNCLLCFQIWATVFLAAFRNTTSRSEIKQMRSTTMQDFSEEALSKQNIQA